MAELIGEIEFSGGGEEFPGICVAPSAVAFGAEEMAARLSDLSRPLWVAGDEKRAGLAFAVPEALAPAGVGLPLLAAAPALPMSNLGDPAFLTEHGLRFPLYSGAMANGIASALMVTEMGRAGFMGSFGAAGLTPARVEEAIAAVQRGLPQGPYAFNLINSPMEPGLEEAVVSLYLARGVRCVEAAAYMALTPAVVRYRAAGLSEEHGEIVAKNRIIAKVSRREVASPFMEPAPERILSKLVAEGSISPLQAELAKRVPMASDVTVEADSGGHTDNRPLVAILPSILALRDELQARHGFPKPVRVGAAGGIATPQAALAAFMMGAAYVVTGSVNQSCVEAGASAHTKRLLAQADMADVAMAPAADMFEMGGKVQVLKRGTFFSVRAQKLHDLYTRHESLDEIPPAEREKLETQVFKKPIGSVWAETRAFFLSRAPEILARAEGHPKRQMALIFRWYVGLASRWSNTGEPGREMDYQIWCGPAMGAFNAWVKNTRLEAPENRRVAEVAFHILSGAAYLLRVRMLSAAGCRIPPAIANYVI